MLDQNERFEINPDLEKDLEKLEAPKKRRKWPLKYKLILFGVLFILGILCIIGIVFVGVNLTTPIPA